MRQRKDTARKRLGELLKDSPDLSQRADGFLAGNLG